MSSFLDEDDENIEAVLDNTNQWQNDYVIYIDTDSLFINIYQFIINQGLQDIFEALDEDLKISYVQRIASCIQDYVNDKSYKITQLEDYNSQEQNHRISFKSELVCKSGLWLKKKKYMLWNVFEDGYKPKENLKVTGLETVRSDTPTIIKPMIKDVMASILNSKDKKDIARVIIEYEKTLKTSGPENISENIAVHDLSKYINRDLICAKGTPRHTKGVANLKIFISKYNLEGKAENISDGDKVKVVYLKKNRFGFNSISFIRWLPEFTEQGLDIDYDRMIAKNFTKKIAPLLEAAGVVIEESSNDDILREWLNFD